MIYEVVSPGSPLRQGDLLYPVPMLEPPKLDCLLEAKEGMFSPFSWTATPEPKAIVVPVVPTWAIVCSQDCDASRAPVISCFHVGTFLEVTRMQLPETAKKRVSLITKKSREEGKWFYLPSAPSLMISEPMAVNFGRVFQLHRATLSAELDSLRKIRLNETAYQHFRESVAQYFRRYPYDEWYSLTQEELQAYEKDKGSVPHYQWQPNDEETGAVTK